jgi:hypothetical protein
MAAPGERVDCAALMALARAAAPERGTSRTLPAPVPGTELRAFRDAEGRLYALLKEPTGWKGNFEGTLCCEGPLPPAALVRGPGSAYISIIGDAEFEELYLRRQHDERQFDVYFDLH